MGSNPTKPPVLPTPRRENKTWTVETDENGKDADVENTHDDRAKVVVIDENQNNEASSAEVDVIDENENNETSNIKVDEIENKCSKASGITSDEISKGETDEILQVCVSIADVRQVTKTSQQQLSDARSQQHSWTETHTMRRNLWRSRLQRTASREPYDSSWRESGSRKRPNVDTALPMHGLQITNGNRANEDRATIFSDFAVPSQQVFWCAG